MGYPESEEAAAPAKLIIPDEWTEAAQTIAYDSITWPPPIILVSGPKNSSKTTFSRHLLNILLPRYRKVAYLDADVGQTEFTPPGCLSLIVIDKIMTTDLTIPCLKTPERCFFFGDKSSKRDQTLYLTYISALFDYYRKEFTMYQKDGMRNIVLPLVVNTPGWVKGAGYDLLVDMLKYIAPSHVVKIRMPVESKNLPAGKFWLDDGDNSTVTLIEISAFRRDSLKRLLPTQKDSHLIRELRILAYFRQCIPSEKNILTIEELACSLAAHSQYEVSLSSITIRHLHCQVPNSKSFYCLNANIIGLAISSEDDENLPICVGLGIVRAIDNFKQVLYIITPVPHSTLEKVDLLLQGFIQIPNCLLQVHGCVSPYMSSNVLSAN